MMNARFLAAGLLSALAATASPGRVVAQPLAENPAESPDRTERLADWKRLTNDAKAHQLAGDFAAAVVAARRVLTLESELFGENSNQVVATWNWIGRCHLELGDSESARAAFTRCAEILAARSDAQPWRVVDARLGVAASQRQATLTPEQLRSIQEARLHVLQAGELEYQMRYADARVEMETAYKTWREILGADSERTLQAQIDLVDLLQLTGEYDRAAELIDEAASRTTRVFGTDHPNTAIALDELGRVLEATGHYVRAVDAFERSAGIFERTVGRRHRYTATALCNLGTLYVRLGELQRAQPLYEEALAINTEILGERHGDTAMTKLGMGHLYRAAGAYAEALSFVEQALEVFRQAYGNGHRRTAVAYNNLGGLYEMVGDYQSAKSCYEQALEAYRATLGDAHQDVAMVMNNLAGVETEMGDFSRGRSLYEQALVIYEQSLGPSHPRVATSLANLACFLDERGAGDEALPLFQRALAIHKAELGDSHPETASTLHNLAHLHATSGDDVRAQELFREALEIRQAALGVNHPDTAASREGLAIALASLGERDVAFAEFVAAAQSEREYLRSQLMLLDDPGMHLLLQKFPLNVAWLASLSIADADHEAALQVLLSEKALAFELLNLRRAAAYLADADEQTNALRRQLLAAQSQVESLILRPPSRFSAAELKQRRAALRGECRRLESMLNQELADFLGTPATLEVSLDDVRRAMSPGSAHIEFFQYDRYDFAATTEQPRWLPPRYAAFVLHASAESPLALIDLGPAADIDALIDQLAEQIDAAKQMAAVVDEQELEAEYRAAAAALSAKLFAPLAEALGEPRLVTVAADGRLHEVAFEALLDDLGQYLIEAGYQFAYLNSGRDLLRPRAAAGSGVVVFAGPNYQAGYQTRLAAAAVATDGRHSLLARTAAPAPSKVLLGPKVSRTVDTRRGWRDLGEPALAEGREAAAAFVDAGFGAVATYVRDGALEEVVKRLASPRVLILITHADFLVNEPEPSSHDAFRTGAWADLATQRGGTGAARLGLRAVEDPLLRSFIVLAGANEIDEEIPADVTVENGWLTAREIAELDLRGTDLVVLSACSTNRGDANNGQAVAGMRSALLFAGARTIVGSLFEVPNAETRHLLKPFYEGVAAGAGKLAALNDAKLQFIRQRRATAGAAHPFYWASFILVGEP